MTEQLTTGWEADVPVGDSLLRRFVFCWAGVCETMARAAGGDVRMTPRFAVADYRRPSGWSNCATLLQPPDHRTFPEVVDEVEAFFADGTGPALLVSAWPTPDLRSRGWELVGHPPLLARPPAALVPPTVRSDVGVSDVTDTPGLTAWERVAVEGYPLPELQPFRPGTLVDPSLLDDPRFLFTTGHENGEPASIGALFTDYGVGCFALGVTRPEARGRGHWRAHAVRRLLAVPDLWTVGLFSDFSRSPAERLGFIPILRFTLWALPRKEMSS